MRPEPRPRQVAEARTPKARRTRREPRWTAGTFRVGDSVPILHTARNGFETRGTGEVIDVNKGIVYVRCAALGNHVYSLDYDRRFWAVAPRVKLDE